MQQRQPPIAAAEIKRNAVRQNGSGDAARRRRHHGRIVELRRRRQHNLAPPEALHAHASTENFHNGARLHVPRRRFAAR